MLLDKWKYLLLSLLMLNNMENIFHAGMTESVNDDVDDYISVYNTSVLHIFSAWYNLAYLPVNNNLKAKVSCKLGRNETVIKY